jgi:quercetin dioxygenase-like cupin family protein
MRLPLKFPDTSSNLAFTLAHASSALAEDYGSIPGANSPKLWNTSGFLLINLTEDASQNPIAAENRSSISKLVWGDNLSANHVQLSPGTEVKMHCHKGIEELILVVGGRGIINATGMNYTIESSDLIHLPVDMPSAMYVLGDENLNLISIYAPQSNGTRTYV